MSADEWLKLFIAVCATFGVFGLSVLLMGRLGWIPMPTLKKEEGRDYFAEIIFLAYDTNDPSHSPTLFHYGEWADEGDIPESMFVAEYELTGTKIYRGGEKIHK